MTGLYDLLRDRGLEPAAVGGLSLGTMVSCAIAGSIARADLFRLLVDAELGDEPSREGRIQACAGAVLPVGSDYETFYGGREGIWLAGDFGMHESGAFRMLLLSGYRDALEAAAAHVPPEYFVFTDEPMAPHCPLRAHVAERVAARLATVPLADPDVVLCSALERGVLTTAAEVADVFVRNIVSPVHLDHLTGEMVARGARMGLVLGPTLPQTFEFPFPVGYLDSPESLEQFEALAATVGVRL
jgi:[acyl-carrier-protein] S-malonyltransferase